MPRVRFNPSPPILGPVYPVPTTTALDDLPTFEGARLEHAIARASGFPLLAHILSLAPLSNQRPHVYVDVRVQQLEPGVMPHKPGWHCDTTPSPAGPGDDDLHHIFVTGEGCLTRFVHDPVELELDPQLLPSRQSLAIQVQLQQSGAELREREIPSCTWVSYGPRDLHRVVAASHSHTRLLVRIRETRLASSPRGLALDSSEGLDAVRMAASYREPVDGLAITKALCALLVEHVQLDLGDSPAGRLLVEVWSQRPPPWATGWYCNLFKELSLDRRWLATSMVSNIVSECEGARKAMRIFERAPARWVAEDGPLLRAHALDELKHAHYFDRLRNMCFPDVSVEAQLAEQIESRLDDTRRWIASPIQRVAHDEDVYMDLIAQIMIGEARTLVQVLLLAVVIGAAFPLASVAALLRELLHDEARHLHYTRRILDRWVGIRGNELVRQCLLRRVDELNEETLRETGGGAEGYRFTRLDDTVLRIDDASMVNPRAIAATTVAREA